MRFVGVAIVACIVGFGVGLLIGRQFPAHGYQKYGETRYMLDSATGKLCDPFKDPKETGNPFDHAFDPNTPKDANGFPVAKDAPSSSADPFAAYGGHEIKPPASNYPPACGK